MLPTAFRSALPGAARVGSFAGVASVRSVFASLSVRGFADAAPPADKPAESPKIQKIFVGNLPWSSTDADLQSMFGKFGSITEAAVIRNKFDGRSRGFGFVTFEGEVADLAVKEMHGQELSGRALNVSLVDPNRSASPFRREDRGQREFRPRDSFSRGPREYRPRERDEFRSRDRDDFRPSRDREYRPRGSRGPRGGFGDE